MIALRVTTDFKIEKIELKEPSRESLRKALGGYPELVRPRRLARPYCMLVDDKGLLKDLQLNSVGSYLYETDKHNQPIVGDIFIMREANSIDGSILVGLQESDIDSLMVQVSRIVRVFDDSYKE